MNMGNWLVKTFIKDYENVQDKTVRFNYGILTTIIGIICNVVLCLIKVISGLIIHSVSVVSDGFNNLSDSLSCIITLIGYKVAGKPADEEHPYGHGRMEYIVSFISCIIIFIVIYELFTESIRKILHPDKVIFDNVLFVILLASILIKVWMAKFNEHLGNQLNNLAMKTVAQDAKNDVFTTLLSIVAMLLSCAYPSIPFDGIGGVILSLFLLYSAYGMAHEIVTAILGTSIDPDLADKIYEALSMNPEVKGVHDLMIHDYGPSTQYGSAHIEVDSDMDLMKAHEIADEAERRILDEYHMVMTIHVDPTEKDTPRSLECKKVIQDALKTFDEKIEIHDFRMVPGQEHINLIFDCVLPFKSVSSFDDITKAIQNGFKDKDYHVHLHIHYEHGYVRERGNDEKV